MTNKFRAPTGLDPTTFPVYSGFIEVYSGSESLHAVYHGMVGDLKTKQVFDNTSSVLGFQLPALINLDNDSPQAPSTNYTFKGADNPILVYRFGTFSFLNYVPLFISNFFTRAGWSLDRHY